MTQSKLQQLDDQESAALELLLHGKAEAAQEIIATLPHGSRKKRLQILVRESEGENGDVLREELAALGPSAENQKALVMNLYAKGDTEGACASLLVYLETWMGDSEAWFQLSQFYIQLGYYSHAMFAMEEVLQIETGNHLYLLAYADLVSAMGMTAMALSYYCASLEISETTRAWLGTFACCDQKNQLLKKLARQKLVSQYQQLASGPALSTLLAYLEENK
ncbi:hypothetical protein HDV03_000231 [Kappamyces sp. JEL0829]|nr:hypothetical protein HDV03_000231 [Kappamyces sp. JEL0829]